MPMGMGELRVERRPPDVLKRMLACYNAISYSASSTSLDIYFSFILRISVSSMDSLFLMNNLPVFVMGLVF